MKLSFDEGSKQFADIQAESRREQNLSDPSKGQVVTLGGPTPTNAPVLQNNKKLNL